MKGQNTTNNKYHIIIDDKLISRLKLEKLTELKFKMGKIFDCIKILSNPDIRNYRTCQVVFYLLRLMKQTHRDTKTRENVHLPHRHALTHTSHSKYKTVER